MIDPLGPDPADPTSTARKTGEVVSEFEVPGSKAPLAPRVRYANYDSPEALVRPEPQPAAAAPLPESRKADQPIKPVKAAPKPMPATKQKPVAESPSTALAHPIPPKPGKL